MIEQILNGCTVDGNLVRLPTIQLDRDIYVKVADKLKKIGGKWKGGKVQAFVFDHDPSDLLADIQSGKARNIKKEFQFFETPEPLAKRLVEIANLDGELDILEPSAGKGAIIRAMNRASYYYEINPLFQEVLAKNPNAVYMGDDFLECRELDFFDRIIANPPFSNNQDVVHIRKMYETLSRGGRLVSIASTHWRDVDGRKEIEFREWLGSKNADIENLPAGTFKESGTMVPATIIVIDKE